MIAYETIPDNGGSLKIHRGEIPPSFWYTGFTNPLNILAASNNHFHIPISLAFYMPTDASNLYVGQYLYLQTQATLSITNYIGLIENPFGGLYNAGQGLKGVYFMRFVPKTLDSYTYNTVEAISDLYLQSDIDDGAAGMPRIDYQLSYLIFKP